MKITFSGNHLYIMPNLNSIITHIEQFNKIKQNTGNNMIVYSNDDYIHVIDGNDYANFRKVEAMNRGLVSSLYLFEKLTAGYRKKATVVDFRDMHK